LLLAPSSLRIRADEFHHLYSSFSDRCKVLGLLDPPHGFIDVEPVSVTAVV
jgi:hypothetical protein